MERKQAELEENAARKEKMKEQLKLTEEFRNALKEKGYFEQFFQKLEDLKQCDIKEYPKLVKNHIQEYSDLVGIPYLEHLKNK